MKICVVNSVTHELMEENKVTSANRKAYCDLHGIDYRVFLGRFSTRYPQWDKIQCVLQNLSEYDWVVWADADVVFNNFDISLKKFIEENKQYDAMFCHDVCWHDQKADHLYVNTGVMIYKNSEWTFDFLRTIWELGPANENIAKINKHSYAGFPHEQGVVGNYLAKNNSKHFKIFDSSAFNQHPNSSGPETFITHFMGSRETETHLATFMRQAKEINRRNGVEVGKTDFINISPKRLLVCSLHTENLNHIAEHSIVNKQDYCKRHHYKFGYLDKRLSSRHPAWDKIEMLRRVLASTEAEWVIWTDNDLFFINHDIRLDILCSVYSKYDLIIGKDAHTQGFDKLDPQTDWRKLPNLRLINTGFIILKNSGWSRQFLDKVWNTKSNTNKGKLNSDEVTTVLNHSYALWPFEQGAFHIALSKEDPERYKILNYPVINCFKEHAKPYHLNCHFVGCSFDLDYYNLLSGKDEGKKYIVELKGSCEFRDKPEDSVVDIPYELKLYKKLGSLYCDVFWGVENTSQKILSHGIRFKQKDGYTVTQFFNSSERNVFRANDFTIDDLEIHHSYEWFGRTNWKKIYPT